MATIAQHRLLTALLDGMALTDTERTSLMAEHLNIVELCQERPEQERSSDIAWLVEEALAEPKRWAPNRMLPQESQRKALRAKLLELLKQEEEDTHAG